MKLPTITLETALEMLRILDSDEDTIRVKSCSCKDSEWIEKSVTQLLGEKDNPNEKANRIYISYWSEESKHGKWVYGTLAGMIMERMGCR